MGDKWKKSMGVSEEVEIEEYELSDFNLPLSHPTLSTFDEKWEVGVVYHQEFDNGDRAYFRADSVQKNKRWKGMKVDEFGGKQKKPKNATADEKTQGWETTPKNEIPKALKEEEEKQFSAFDKIRGIRKKLNEGLDRHAIQELKLYIENDRDLYRQQIVPIIKNIQRRMKKGTYDHLKAPKLWMYLVDNGAKKYVKEFGGDVKSQFPKDVRHSVAVEFANEYRAEIEAQGGEML